MSEYLEKAKNILHVAEDENSKHPDLWLSPAASAYAQAWATIAQAESLERIATALEAITGCIGHDSKLGNIFVVTNREIK